MIVRENVRPDLWTGLASSAFLRKGLRNLKRAFRSWAYMGQPFCWGVRDRIRPVGRCQEGGGDGRGRGYWTRITMKTGV